MKYPRWTIVFIPLFLGVLALIIWKMVSSLKENYLIHGVVHQSRSVLTPKEFQSAVEERLVVDMSRQNDLLLGPDTLENSQNLQKILSIPSKGDMNLLKILPNRSNYGVGRIKLASTSTTHQYLSVSQSGIDSPSQTLFSLSPIASVPSGGQAIVMATNLGSNKLRFDILQIGGPNS